MQIITLATLIRQLRVILRDLQQELHSDGVFVFYMNPLPVHELGVCIMSNKREIR
jgi:hypothetical protein